jgi:cytochrome c biogenesis protein CcdA
MRMLQLLASFFLGVLTSAYWVNIQPILASVLFISN